MWFTTTPFAIFAVGVEVEEAEEETGGAVDMGDDDGGDWLIDTTTSSMGW